MHYLYMSQVGWDRSLVCLVQCSQDNMLAPCHRVLRVINHVFHKLRDSCCCWLLDCKIIQFSHRCPFLRCKLINHQCKHKGSRHGTHEGCNFFLNLNDGGASGGRESEGVSGGSHNDI